MISFFAQAYDSTIYYPRDSSDQAISILLVILPILLWMTVIAYVITAIFMGLIFKKAGIPAWKAWVPIYSTWTFLELGSQRGIWAILALVPVVNYIALIFMYIAYYYVSKGFGKQGTFVLWAIFLQPVWLIWLAIDNSTWKGAGAPQAQSSRSNT